MKGGAGPAETLRLDKWLFFARFVKHRQIAAEIVGKRRVRLNDLLVTTPHQAVRVGDVATLVRPDSVMVIRILSLGTRRGPASEARTLYEIVDQA